MKFLLSYSGILVKGLFVALVIWASYKMTAITLPYIYPENYSKADFLKDNFLRTKYAVWHIKYWRWGFFIHIFSSVFLLLAGLTQFSARILGKYALLHRYAGFTYMVILIFVSAPGAMAMAIHANGGIAAKTSFVFLTLLWFIFTVSAWFALRKKNYILHGEFMLRSYALTLSAITLRIYVYIFTAYKLQGVKPAELYTAIAWMSWVPNLILSELIIRRGFIIKLMKRRLIYK